MDAKRDLSERKIPRAHAVIIVTCLGIIGGVTLLYPLVDKPIGIDLLGIIMLLFIVILALLDHAGVKISKAIKWVKK